MTVVFDFQDCVVQDVFQLRCLAFERGNTAALNAVVRSFVTGVFTHVIKTCHAAFESGEDLDDEIIEMMRHVFEARLALMTSIPLCPDDMSFRRMISDLHYADENLREFTSAVLVLDDAAYDDAIDGLWWMVTGDEWFCSRHRIEQHLPRGLLDALLRR